MKSVRFVLTMICFILVASCGPAATAVTPVHATATETAVPATASSTQPPTAIVSTAIPTVTPIPTIGLLGEYFNNFRVAGPPNAVRIDPQVDFSWGG